MLTVPASLSQSFESQLSLRNIPDQQRRDCHKWLRFYLDFCAKYASDPKLTASFAGFDEKLKIKGQSDAQRMEARRAIAIYYRIIGTLQSQTAPSGTSNPDPSSQVGLLATKQEVPLKLTGANWELVYERLQAAIKVRHYSNKTWQAYTAIGYSSFNPLLKARMPVCWI